MPLSCSRRAFLMAGGAALTATAAGRLKVGLQFYTLRDPLGKKPDETLEAIAQIGVPYAEVLRANIAAIAPTMKRLKIQPVSMHVETPLFTGDFSAWGMVPKTLTLDAALEEAKRHGIRYVVCPYIMPKERGGADTFRKLADQLNKAGEACRKAGLRLAYHNHAFEYAPLDGTRGIDILMSRTDPKLVALELDLFWVSVAGQDPVAALREHAGRVPLVHLKDKNKATPQRFAEDVARDSFKELGEGTLDWKAILAAAEKAGVEYGFVEQDQTPGDPVESVRKSWGYLKSLKAVS